MKLLILFVFGVALAAPTHVTVPTRRLTVAEIPLPCYPDPCPPDTSKVVR